MIDGDLFGGGSTIQIDGTVRGSLYLVGGQLDISGKIGKDIHFAGGVMTLKPTAEFLSDNADVISVSMSTEIDGVRIPGSITSVSYQLLINGDVSREISFWGSALTINGAVDGDVTRDRRRPGFDRRERTAHALRLPADRTQSDQSRPASSPKAARSTGSFAIPAPKKAKSRSHCPIRRSTRPSRRKRDLSPPENSLTDNLREYLGAAIRELISLAFIGLVAVLLISAHRASADPQPARSPADQFWHRSADLHHLDFDLLYRHSAVGVCAGAAAAGAAVERSRADRRGDCAAARPGRRGAVLFWGDLHLACDRLHRAGAVSWCACCSATARSAT